MRIRTIQALLLAQFVTTAITTGTKDDTYDYIVVGAGVSGLVVANRLTGDKNVSVLVIERGSFDDKPEAIVPYYANGLDLDVLISPTSAPNPQLNNDTFSVAVPAVVGGGSVVNGMGYLRGSKEDYDAWEALGNPGWGWDDLLPYFRKSTTFTPPTPDAVNEFNITWDHTAYDNGPLHVHIPSFQYPDINTIWDAFRSQDDIPVRADENAGNGPGAYWLPSTIDGCDMTRSTARKAYYDPVNATRPNLHLLTGHTARQILFTESGPSLTANGVRIICRANNSTRQVYARKEVILAAGAIQTPQLLQVSGIGPSSVLKAARIRVKKDLPAVGTNLQDHATTILIFSLTNQSFPNPDSLTTNTTYFDAAWAEYLANLTGPISAAPASSAILFGLPHLNTSAAASATAVKLLSQSSSETLSYLPPIYSTTPSLLRGFTLQRSLLAKSYLSPNSSIVAHSMPGNGFMPAPLLKPLSRGTVTLDPSDPFGLPVVQYNTLQNPIDADNVLAIIRRAREFWRSPALVKRFGPISEISPGAQFETDEEILDELKRNHDIFWPSLAHPSGTCAMMPEKLGGCVDRELKVYGVKRLRVVDASIMPLIVGGGLQATVYAVAEKAADFIKGRRLPRAKDGQEVGSSGASGGSYRMSNSGGDYTKKRR
ncbi:hypothetical protein SMACR_07654 [Sordaria macrospora]|uniref:Glucose-methanol-choline oxidoreductase N-terminal domain-containing protein n=1 Tax=Sordaria macrospora TaxID=5147 RepID=A0A8S8ZCT7_SORMA|nr:hypothetical protein SMACR_07654 [Sordaria macrospora]WPJ66229.1 hypothetical protein SMAC4_07654 [Sordaria macrospora]